MRQTQSLWAHNLPPIVATAFRLTSLSYAVWLYHHFCLSFRVVEELLADRGVTVSYEAVRQGKLHYLWRAGDQDSEVWDILVQRFCRRL